MTLQEFITSLFEFILMVAIPFGLKTLYNYVMSVVEEKTQTIENQKIKDYINSAVQALWKTVDATYQTYVESLKKQGKFDEEAQKAAFEEAKKAALLLISEDVKNAIEQMYGDFDEWVNKTIEQLVLANKSDNKTEIVMSMML